MLRKMKIYFTYILLSALFIITGCDKFAPTELVGNGEDSDNYEIEVIGSDLDNEFFSSGYDTSGVTTELRLHGSVISVSGIKLTHNGSTQQISSAQAFFADTSKPVFSVSGKFIGYNTITPGIVRFNSETARQVNFRLRFRDHGSLTDTILGKKYELFNSNRRFFDDDFVYPFNSNVQFSFIPFLSQPVELNIPTPKEVTGYVRLNYSTGKQHGFAELKWSADFKDNFFVIVGGVHSSGQMVFPIFRIRTADDGSLYLPASLFKNIPKSRFNKLSFSFIRRHENSVQIDQYRMHINSQSIHTIFVDFP